MIDPIGSELLHHPLGRRRFMVTLAGGLLAAPLAAEGQQEEKVPRIGLLDYSSPDQARITWWEAFQQRMRELAELSPSSDDGRMGTSSGFRVWPPTLCASR